ncbi:MAG: hypothetical protein J5802_13170 [Butyrivibrio sp.]|nr:hypothetical protein [Butyrivibrio sp.]
MYKKGDKVIILDYNGKPMIPNVVGVIEEVYGKDRVRLMLPDKACCLEFVDRLQKIDEVQYESILNSVRSSEKSLPVDLQLDIRKFAAKHPRRKKTEIINMFDQDKRYISILHAYSGRVMMYGKENINEHFLYEYNDAVRGIRRTRTFFHELDESIPVPDI